MWLEFFSIEVLLLIINCKCEFEILITRSMPHKVNYEDYDYGDYDEYEDYDDYDYDVEDNG